MGACAGLGAHGSVLRRLARSLRSLLAIGGIILLAGGVWAWGVVALLATAVLVLLPAGVDRRRVKHLQNRAGAIRESLAVRGRGQVEIFRARRELAELEADRSRLYADLGRAVYEEDEAGTKAARTALAAVLERVQAKEAEIQTLIRETEERVRRVQGPVQATEVLAGRSAARAAARAGALAAAGRGRHPRAAPARSGRPDAGPRTSPRRRFTRRLPGPRARSQYAVFPAFRPVPVCERYGSRVQRCGRRPLTQLAGGAQGRPGPRRKSP